MSVSLFIDKQILTQKPTKPQHFSTREISSQDMDLLMKHDPFLYYSIPAVRNATLLNKDEDMFLLSSQSRESDFASGAKHSLKVNRQGRLTTECHSTKIMESFFHFNSNDFRFDEDDEQEDDLYFFLKQLESESSIPKYHINLCKQANENSTEKFELHMEDDPFSYNSSPEHCPASRLY